MTEVEWARPRNLLFYHLRGASLASLHGHSVIGGPAALCRLAQVVYWHGRGEMTVCDLWHNLFIFVLSMLDGERVCKSACEWLWDIYYLKRFNCGKQVSVEKWRPSSFILVPLLMHSLLRNCGRLIYGHRCLENDLWGFDSWLFCFQTDRKLNLHWLPYILGSPLLYARILLLIYARKTSSMKMVSIQE